MGLGIVILHNRYPDEILSTKIIGERQFQTAVDLFKYAKEELTGKVDYRHTYLNFTDIEVELDGNNVVRTCPAALGPGFAAGTTDGPGFPGFQQGDTEVGRVFLGQKAHETSTVGVMVIESLMRCVICMQISEEWKRFRDSLKKPSKYQEDCQQPKPVLLDTGEMFKPYAWAVRPLHHSPYSLTKKYLFYLLRTQISISDCRKKQDEYR